jgi:hypothetical protein
MLFLLGGCGESIVSSLTTPAGVNSSAPNISVDVGGNPILSWQRREENVTILEYSMFVEGTWSEPVEVARGEDWFVNWADIPAVQPVTESFWAAHYLERTPGGKYAYDVRMRLSDDGGKNWRDAGSPHQDGTFTEHGFVSLYANDNRLGVIWLDGRETSPQIAENDHHAMHGGMTLRSVSMDREGRYDNRQQIDDLVCDCCQTAALMVRDTPLVLYRDRTESEYRDISSSRWLEGAWTPPQSLGNDGWQISACPVNGPALVGTQDQLAAIWFSGAGGQNNVFLARSSDGGKSFDRKMKINKGAPLGRVAAVIYPDQSLFVVWIRRDNAGGAKIVGRYVSPENVLGDVAELVDVSPTRSSGFPKLVLSKSDTILAWTDQSQSTPQVKTARVHVESLR